MGQELFGGMDRAVTQLRQAVPGSDGYYRILNDIVEGLTSSKNALGTAALLDAGSKPGQLPPVERRGKLPDDVTPTEPVLNELGTAAYRDVGTGVGNVPTIGTDGTIPDAVLPDPDAPGRPRFIPANLGRANVPTGGDTGITVPQPANVPWLLINFGRYATTAGDPDTTRPRDAVWALIRTQELFSVEGWIQVWTSRIARIRRTSGGTLEVGVVPGIRETPDFMPVTVYGLYPSFFETDELGSASSTGSVATRVDVPDPEVYPYFLLSLSSSNFAAAPFASSTPGRTINPWPTGTFWGNYHWVNTDAFRRFAVSRQFVLGYSPTYLGLQNFRDQIYVNLQSRFESAGLSVRVFGVKGLPTQEVGSADLSSTFRFLWRGTNIRTPDSGWGLVDTRDFRRFGPLSSLSGLISGSLIQSGTPYVIRFSDFEELAIGIPEGPPSEDQALSLGEFPGRSWPADVDVGTPRFEHYLGKTGGGLLLSTTEDTELFTIR